MNAGIILESVLTCPHCGFSRGYPFSVIEMPCRGIDGLVAQKRVE